MRVKCVLMLAVLACTAGCFSTAGFVPRSSQLADSRFTVKTHDGWLLSVRHYRPATRDSSKLPVVLMHGFGVNGTFWTLDERTDLAHYLSKKRNFDVYVPDLRGMGRSRPANPFGSFVGSGVGEEREDIYEWELDDYARTDVPAIIAAIRKRTKAPRVNWVGHSMGGMVMYAYLVRNEQPPDDVHTFVAVGSPVFLFLPADKMVKDMQDMAWVLEYVSVKSVLQGLSAFAGGGNMTPFDTLYYSRDNVTADTVKRMYAHCMEDLPEGVAYQLNQMAETGEFHDFAGKFNYSRHLGRVRVPMLLLAGKGDNMVPPGVVVAAMKRVGSTDKQWIHLAKANKFSADYGHCDMIWGKNAPQEVFPIIADWLDQRQKLQPAAASQP